MRRWLTVGLLVVAFGGGLHGRTPEAFIGLDSAHLACFAFNQTAVFAS